MQSKMLLMKKLYHCDSCPQVTLLVEGWCPLRHSMGPPLLSNDLLVCYGPVPVVLHPVQTGCPSGGGLVSYVSQYGAAFVV
jgi:hypothetical protein